MIARNDDRRSANAQNDLQLFRPDLFRAQGTGVRIIASIVNQNVDVWSISSSSWEPNDRSEHDCFCCTAYERKSSLSSIAIRILIKVTLLDIGYLYGVDFSPLLSRLLNFNLRFA